MSKKEAILKAATKLFAQKGFKDTSMSELARMTGVAQGTIFYHYRSKEDLFLAIMDELKISITDELRKYRGEFQFETGMDMLEDAICLYLSLVGTMEDRFLLLYRHYAYEFAEVNPICRECIESIYTSLADVFEKAILLGKQDGSMADVPTRETALIIFSMIDGLVRFKIYRLFDAEALYKELIGACRTIVKTQFH